MHHSLTGDLFNFKETVKTISADLIFGKYEELDEDFVLEFDLHISDAKKAYGMDEGRTIIHDFNMKDHDGEDHPGGIAVDYHHK